MNPTETADDTVALTDRSVRLLLVDDNQDALELLSAILTARGHVVNTAFDGPSALRLAIESPPQVALLNIGLPVMDGYELGRRLRDAHSAVRIVAVTGYGQASARTRSREAGFDAHLVKPVEVDELDRLIQNLASASE